MSDYISKSALIETLRNYAEQKHCGGETVLANGILKAVCFIEKEENIPTVSETEIIRKVFERVVERLENEKERNDISCTYWDKHDWKDSIQYNEYDMSRKKSECFAEAIEIVKEECGINE